jgi:murein DD-endopeptidase MepM/ murein hydrolase activator NlpD
MATPPGGQNMVSADDRETFSSMPGHFDKIFKKTEEGLRKSVEQTKKLVEYAEKYRDAMLEASSGGRGRGVGGQNIGLGTFSSGTRGQQIAMGVGMTAAVGGSLYMSMAPNTMAAVTQRMYADSIAGLSGTLGGAQGLIRQSNRLVGNGATSAMGPTAAAATLAYSGGYLAQTLSSRNIMGQLGGMSAITGASNEQVAGAFAGINAMNFLRAGIRARDKNGELVRPEQLINQAYRFLYGGRKITKDQAMMVLNPGSKGYSTLSKLAGGDPALLQQLQMGVIARASKGSSLNQKDLSDSNRALDLMGVGKESPLRSIFRYNTSEARKLEATEGGLVGGYNTALRGTAAVNDGFSTMANLLGPINQGLMTLKGILETLPGAGNTGSTLSKVGGLGIGALGSALQLGLTARMLGVGGAKGFLGTGALAKAGSTAATTGGVTGLANASKFARFGKLVPGLGAAASGFSGYSDAKNNRGFFGGLMSSMAAGGVTAGVVGGIATGGLFAIPAAIAGAVASGVGYTAGRVMGGGIGGDSDCGHGNMGCSHGIGGDNEGSSPSGKVFQLPVPQGTPVSSPYGPRPDAAKRNPGISSYHRGIDYALPMGSPVLASADGVVSETGTHRQYGFYVIIRHAAKSSLYGHLSKILVRKGQRVSRGEQIALSGGKKGHPGAGSSTGPHLHFEIRAHGGVGAQDRQDPKSFFGKAFSFIKNLGSKAVGALKSMGRSLINTVTRSSGSNKESFPVSDYGMPISQKYGSPSISQLLSMFGNGSVNYDKLTSGINPNNKKYKDHFDNKNTPAAGDAGGIVGGSRAGLLRFLQSVGFKGDALQTAFAVALAESGGIASRHSDPRLKGDDSYGLFQINMIGGLGPDRRKRYNLRSNKDLYDPRKNAEVAYKMTGGGKNWSRWSTYTKGTFLNYLDDADRLMKKENIGGDNGSMGSLALASTETTGSTMSGGSRGGNATLTTNAKVEVHVNMNVQIARASIGEANKLADDTLKRLESKLKYGEGLGLY